LTHPFNWKKASRAAALCSGVRGGGAQLAFHVTAGSYDTNTLIEVLGELRRFLGGEKATLLWDGLPAHRSRAMRAWLNRQRSWLVVERLPAYAPELNPPEGLWSNLKTVELANLTSPTLAEVIDQAHKGIDRVRRTPTCPSRSWATPACRFPELQSPGFQRRSAGAAGTSGRRRLEQLDGIASRVIQQDLPATKPAHDVVAEPRSRLAQAVDLAVEIIDLQLDPVPAARLGPATIRHRLGGPTRAAHCVHQQPQIAAREHGEAGRGVQLNGEAEPLGIERDRCIDVVDDVADADSGHRSAPCGQRSTIGTAHHGRPAHHTANPAATLNPTPTSR
jgi:hypothetical protein